MTATASKLVQSRLLTCPACNGPVEVKSRHVAIAGTTVRVYCSANCMRAGGPKPAEPLPVVLEPVAPARRWVWWLAGGIAIGATCLVMFAANGDDEADASSLPWPPIPVAVEPPRPAPPPVVEPDPRREEEQALLQELARDAWIHPLAGPTRRMPINHNGAFGALRAGDRPPECYSGHCGVDVGRVWGEPIHAVHDGVVEWVDRGPNDERGGIFVKIAHRDGTLFSWYFHLAAVPRWVHRGVKVSAGQVIGLLGDTGVKQSVPHLHFSLSVKSSKTTHERYLDPEPLIAIWPLWIPGDPERRGRLSITTEPGMPVRNHSKAKAKRKSAKPEGAAPESVPLSTEATATPQPEPPPTQPAQ